MRRYHQTSSYNQSRLLDTIAHKLAAMHDLHLATIIGVTPSLISKIRTGRSPVSAAFLVRVNELTGIEIAALRSVMGDRRELFRISEVYVPKRKIQVRKSLTGLEDQFCTG